jgi:hypothetical protein
MKLGRNLPKVWRPTLEAGRYLKTSRSSFSSIGVNGQVAIGEHSLVPLPARPVADRWEHQAIMSLHDAAGNDMVGDCTCAGILKLDVAWSHNAGIDYWPAMTPTALDLYSAATGYNPLNPASDQGAELVQILKFVRAHGVDVDGHGKGLQWVSVDATKPAEVAKALDTFGGLYTGAQISPDWLQNPHEGSVWDVASPGGADDGHCVAVFDYNEQGVIANSWGFFITITWEALAKYWSKSAGGEVYAVFSPDWLTRATEKSPSGFNAAQLAADLKAFE